MQTEWQDIDHTKIQSFLASNGWERKEDLLKGVAEQYIKDTNLIELITEPKLPNYRKYLRDSIQALSILESKTKEEIFNLISTVESHLLSVKLNSGMSRHRI